MCSPALSSEQAQAVSSHGCPDGECRGAVEYRPSPSPLGADEKREYCGSWRVARQHHFVRSRMALRASCQLPVRCHVKRDFNYLQYVQIIS
jgi:hypothetical protein